MNKVTYIRIGVDDGRARDTVYGDVLRSDSTLSVGVWMPAELRRILATAWLSNKIADIARDFGRGVIDIDEAVRRASEAADKAQ